MEDLLLTVALVGREGGNADVRLEDFVKQLDQILKALRATERHLSHEANTLDFRVADLRHASPATVVVRAERRSVTARDWRRPTVETFVKGLGQIQTTGTAPPNLDPDLLRQYKDLASRVSEEMPIVTVSFEREHADISRALERQIEAIIGDDEPEYGSVSGMLDAINIHDGKNTFWVYPIVGGPNRVGCRFPQDMLHVATSAVGRYVTVTGMVKTKARAKFPHEVNVVDLEMHPPEEELPSLADLRGTAPNATGTAASEDFVRRVRDAWR